MHAGNDHFTITFPRIIRRRFIGGGNGRIQRILSVRDADRIFILQNGTLVIGTHDTLVKTNAYYREVCELQDIPNLPPFEGEVK